MVMETNTNKDPAVDDIDTSQYYVIRKGEYDDMKAEIERLRAAGDALHAWIIVNATSQQQDMFGKVLADWEEARRG